MSHEASPTPNPIDQLPAGFENAFDPAARHDATAEAVSWNQYFSILDRPVQTEPMSLQIDGSPTTPDGDPNPHYLHKSIARTETPGTAATETGVDTGYIRSLDTPAGPIRMSELPRGIRVNETANKTISQIRESLAATREDIATAGSDHTETVTRVKKDGTFKQKETTIGADKTAELVLQEQLSEQLDGLAMKLARSGMSDDRILETIIALNEGTPAYRRKIGETRKGKAKYETVPAKEGLSLTEEEITRVLNGITFVQASDEAGRAARKAEEEARSGELPRAEDGLGAGREADDSDDERGEGTLASVAALGAAAVGAAGVAYARHKGIEMGSEHVSAAGFGMFGLRARMAASRSSRNEAKANRLRGRNQAGAPAALDLVEKQIKNPVRAVVPGADFGARHRTARLSPHGLNLTPGGRPKLDLAATAGSSGRGERKAAEAGRLANENRELAANANRVIELYGDVVLDKDAFDEVIKNSGLNYRQRRSLRGSAREARRSRGIEEETLHELQEMAEGHGSKRSQRRINRAERRKAKADAKIPELEAKAERAERKKEKRGEQKQANKAKRREYVRGLRELRNYELAERADDRAGFYESLADVVEGIRDGDDTRKLTREPRGIAERRARRGATRRLNRLVAAREQGDASVITRRTETVNRTAQRRREHKFTSDRIARKDERVTVNRTKVAQHRAARVAAQARADAIVV